MERFVSEYLVGIQDGVQAVFEDPASPRTWGGYVAAIIAFYLTTLAGRWGFRGTRGGVKMAIRRWRGEHLPLSQQTQHLLARLADPEAWDWTGAVLKSKTSGHTSVTCEVYSNKRPLVNLRIDDISYDLVANCNRHEQKELERAVRAMIDLKTRESQEKIRKAATDALARL